MAYTPTAVPDESTFTEGTTGVVAAAGEFNDASPDLGAGQTGAVRITKRRAAHANLRDSSGIELGTVANPLNVASAGGGGGPATIANGADVAQGSTTDAAITTDTNGTVIGFLRGLVKMIASVWDSVNGRLKVDGSGVTQPVSGTFWQATQPVSGTVTANAGSGTFSADVTDRVARKLGQAFLRNPGDTANMGDGTTPVRVDPTGTTTQPVSATSLPLPTGAATEATLAAIKTDVDKIPASPSQEHTTAASPASVRLSDGAAFYRGTTPADTQPVSGTFWQATQPVSGTVTANQGSAGATAWPVIASSATPTRSSVASSTAAVTLLAANSARRGAAIFNDSTKVLKIALGAAAGTADFTDSLGSMAYYEVPFGYTGVITGLWTAANGAARLTEVV